MRSLRGAIALLLLAALAGCASIPSSGSVQSGVELGGSNAVELDILARGPQDGDSPEQILTGFLAAAASPQLDYRIAREFLTADASRDWRPDSSATVDQSQYRVVDATADGALALRIRTSATVSDTGQYSVAAAGTAETRNYRFALVDGQWRISSAPQGIIIDQATFGIVFGAHALRFFSPDEQVLVPDVRWFARRETTQTAIVRALIGGPVGWLQPGVISAVPAGARLDADTVPVNGSTAMVNLAVDTVPDAVAIAHMRAQFESSLVGVSGITAVNLTLNGAAVSSAQLVPYPTLSPRVDGRPAALTADGFGFLSLLSGQVTPDQQLTVPIRSSSPSAIVLGPAAAVAGTLSPEGVSRVTAGESELVWSGSDWRAVSIDSSGGLWASRDAELLNWQGSDGSLFELSTGWGPVDLDGLAVSRDGTRVAAVLQADGVSRIVVSAIARNTLGQPTGLGQPQLVSQLEGTVRSLTWVDPTTLGAVHGDAASPSITLAAVGGQSSELVAPAGASTMVAGNSARELYVLDTNGQVFQPSGSAWQVKASGVRILATQVGTG